MTIKNIELLKESKTQSEIDGTQFQLYRELKKLVEKHLINELEIISADDKEVILQVRLNKGTGSIAELIAEDHRRNPYG